MLFRSPSPEGQARIDVFSNNTLSHYAVLQAAGDMGVKRIVYASSETVTGIIHGRRPTAIPFDESQTCPDGRRLRILNPGSPTDKRRQPHRTLGLLDVADGRVAGYALVALP